MNIFERWFLTRIIKREVRQGYDHAAVLNSALSQDELHKEHKWLVLPEKVELI